MPIPSRSPERLLELLATTEVVEFHDLQHALGQASPATTFRYLSQIPYHRSYNYNGRFYTAQDRRRYDRYGLFAIGDIYFSRHGTLARTVQRLVEESRAGWTQRELQELLRVRVQPLLLAAVRSAGLAREKLDGLYVYLHAQRSVGAAQLQRRGEQRRSQAATSGEGSLEVSDAVVIQILLTLIRHPGSDVAQVVRRLRGHSPPISTPEVRLVFARYELDNFGEKGGTSNC